MLQRATASVVMGACLALAVLAGCRGEAASSEAATDARPDARVELDAQLARNLPEGTSVEEAERGRDLFLVCATCHGLDAGGTQLGPSLSDGEWRHGSGTVEEIEQIVRQGIPEPEDYPIPMPPGGGGTFDEEELRALAAYVYAVSRGGAAAPREPATPPPAGEGTAPARVPTR